MRQRSSWSRASGSSSPCNLSAGNCLRCRLTEIRMRSSAPAWEFFESGRFASTFAVAFLFEPFSRTLFWMLLDEARQMSFSVVLIDAVRLYCGARSGSVWCSRSRYRLSVDWRGALRPPRRREELPSRVFCQVVVGAERLLPMLGAELFSSSVALRSSVVSILSIKIFSLVSCNTYCKLCWLSYVKAFEKCSGVKRV